MLTHYCGPSRTLYHPHHPQHGRDIFHWMQHRKTRILNTEVTVWHNVGKCEQNQGWLWHNSTLGAEHRREYSTLFSAAFMYPVNNASHTADHGPQTAYRTALYNYLKENHEKHVERGQRAKIRTRRSMAQPQVSDGAAGPAPIGDVTEASLQFDLSSIPHQILFPFFRVSYARILFPATPLVRGSEHLAFRQNNGMKNSKTSIIRLFLRHTSNPSHSWDESVVSWFHVLREQLISLSANALPYLDNLVARME